VRGAAMLFGAQFTLMLSSYVVALALARGLAPELYGVYGIVYSFLLSVELVGRLGLPQAVARLVATRREVEPTLEATGFTLALLVYSIIFAGFWLAAPQLADLFHVADGTRLFRIAALDIPFYGLYFMLMHILNGRRLFHLQCMGTITYGLTKGAEILALVQIGPSVEGALIVNVVGSIIALGIVAFCVGRTPFRLTLALRTPVIELALPVSVIALGTQILISVDLWVLNAVGTAVEASVKGLYVAAGNVARLPNFVAFVMSAVLVPSIAAALASDDHATARAHLAGAARFMTIVLVPGCTLIAVNAGEVLALLFSSEYAAGAPILVVLIVAHGLLYTIFMSFANVLIGAGRAGASARLSLAALVFGGALSIVLVLKAGAYGAVVAALIANATALIGASILVGRTITWPFKAPVWSRVLPLTAGIGLPSWWVEAHGLMLLVEFAVLGIAYAALLPLLGLVRRTDVESFVPSWINRAG
jgi:O-antigen/teichoic acid export membrane protein